MILMDFDGLVKSVVWPAQDLYGLSQSVHLPGYACGCPACVHDFLCQSNVCVLSGMELAVKHCRHYGRQHIPAHSIAATGTCAMLVAAGWNASRA